MNEDIIKMLDIYKTYEFDWMGQKIESLSDLTRHHIVKKQYDGMDDINNYALLTTYSHHLIHYLEDNYYKEYVELNKLFKELNLSLEPPTTEYYEKVRRILKRVKKDMKNKNRKRGRAR